MKTAMTLLMPLNPLGNPSVGFLGSLPEKLILIIKKLEPAFANLNTRKIIGPDISRRFPVNFRVKTDVKIANIGKLDYQSTSPSLLFSV